MKQLRAPILLIILLLGHLQCVDNKNIDTQNSTSNSTELNHIETALQQEKDSFERIETEEELLAMELFDQGYTIDNDRILRDSSRENVWIDTIPPMLKDIARQQQLFCPDTIPSCAACGYCSFIKLSTDWTYFAYETSETKHYNNIYVFKKTDKQYQVIDTLYGWVVYAKPTAPTSVYQIALLEAYWGDNRPKNFERYEFNGKRYTLKSSHKTAWIKPDKQ